MSRYTYGDLEEVADLLPLFHRPKFSDLLLFIVSDSEEKQLEGSEFVKSLLEKELESSQEKNNLASYSVNLIDLKKEQAPEGYFWQNMDPTRIDIPIFYNSDKHPNIPQQLFDSRNSGVVALTRQGYRDVINPSKRDCFEVIYLD